MHWKTRFGVSMCMGITAISSILLCGMGSSGQISTDTTTQKSVSQHASADTGYCLRNCNGWIGVYLGEELIQCTEISVDTLRIGDQQMLEKGIHTESWNELLLLLEDFGS